jgi:hypothetical protein
LYPSHLLNFLISIDAEDPGPNEEGRDTVESCSVLLDGDTGGAAGDATGDAIGGATNAASDAAAGDAAGDVTGDATGAVAGTAADASTVDAARAHWR